MTPEQFQQRLLKWFDCHGRKELPWQSTPSNAYTIWVSEIMLQQTQVGVVIPYFDLFIKRFPDTQTLACSELDTVLEHWAGLGYYARARNLHKSAQIICREYQGELPSELKALCDLPGIGRSTGSAILSMAFSKPYAILDGNVKRVLTRFYGVEGWPGKSDVSKRLWELSETLTPVDRVADYTQAIMDLGATLCTRRNPDCANCPINGGCIARKTQRVTEFPTPRKFQNLPIKQCYMSVLMDSESAVYLQKRAPKGIWGGLWSLPEHTEQDALLDWFSQRMIDVTALQWLPLRKHTFSHYHLHFQPVVAVSTQLQIISEGSQSCWFNPEHQKPAMPAPIQKLLRDIQRNECKFEP